ncbi:uncharacterized protein LOC119079753 [Bradysia coprophila]|uniref:uncharacterized protein LOC119079753 n=1 Tax=Bradysia coprophila TaxID=38358 RepID=UPI00187D859E|nr:uncharacterized protein LOC119079753 [Bradysia coprophila]
MSNEIETIDIDEEVLDYELELELDVAMDQRHEDALLDEVGDNYGEEHENELVRKMSIASVSPIAPQATVSPTEPASTYPNDLWSKSISTLVNVLQSSATELANNAVEPQSIFKNNIDFNNAQPVTEAILPVQLEQDSLDGEQKAVTEPEKLEPRSVEPKDDVVSTSPGPQGIMKVSNKIPILAPTPAASSSSSSSKQKVKAKRNRNKMRRFEHRVARTNGHGPVRQVHRIPSLMSIKTQFPFPRTRFPLSIPEKAPAPVTRKKVPFIIKAQANGDSVSRTVTVNPEFEGFASPFSRSYFNSVMLKPRRSTTPRVTICSSVRTALEQTAPLPMVVDTGEMTDDDRKYLVAIEEQKKRRERVLREKERKRGLEGYQFTDH